MKRIQITKGKTPFTARISSVKSGAIVWGLDEKRKFGDERCGLIQRG